MHLDPREVMILQIQERVKELEEELAVARSMKDPSGENFVGKTSYLVRSTTALLETNKAILRKLGAGYIPLVKDMH